MCVTLRICQQSPRPDCCNLRSSSIASFHFLSSSHFRYLAGDMSSARHTDKLVIRHKLFYCSVFQRSSCAAADHIYVVYNSVFQREAEMARGATTRPHYHFNISAVGGFSPALVFRSSDSRHVGFGAMGSYIFVCRIHSAYHQECTAGNQKP